MYPSWPGLTIFSGSDVLQEDLVDKEEKGGGERMGKRKEKPGLLKAPVWLPLLERDLTQWSPLSPEVNCFQLAQQ